MSQKPQYICDGCNKPIGEKPHLSLVFNPCQACGVALPPGTRKDQTSWTMARLIQSGKNFLHFHNGKCIGLWADNEIKLATKKKDSKG